MGPAMPEMLVTFDAPAAAAPTMIESFLPFAVILAIFYFLIGRPQAQKQKAQESMVAALKKDDKVVTSSGLHGRIAEVGTDTVVIEVAGKTRLTFDKSAVARKVGEEASAEAAK
jgi:preprotein translocase subunit YajC